jgi:signal transduction histidine kinase
MMSRETNAGSPYTQRHHGIQAQARMRREPLRPERSQPSLMTTPQDTPPAKLTEPPGEDGGHMRFRWYDLRFTGPSSHLETPFREDYAQRSVKHARLALLLGILLFAAFGILDALLLPEVKESLWAIRFGVMIPATLVVFLTTWTDWFSRWMQLILAATVVGAGSGITAMVVIAPPPVNHLYYVGNILVIIFGYTFFRLRFVWGTLSGWIVVALYQFAALVLVETPTEILVNNSFFFFSANFIGMVACYAMEYYARRDFFLVHALSRERARVEAAREELEERVEERTRELSLINLTLEKEVVQRRQAEADRNALEEQLAQAQRMEAIGNLAAGVAHDLNNTLSGLVGWPEMVLMDLEPDSPLVEPIRVIQQSGQSAAAVVQDLLTLARRGVEVKKEGIDLSKVVQTELGSLAFRRLEESHPHVTVQATLSPDLLPVVGSPIHLGKAVSNLISNAVEANLVEGSVTLRTENRCLEEPHSGIEVVPAGEYVVFTVSDTGVGIAQEDVRRIFEPFFTKKSMGRSGTGRGMTVVWGTVKDHGGYLDVRSSEGHGTTFEVFLPISRRSSIQPEPRRTLEDLMGTERILVVDDLESQRSIAASMLTKLGYQVVGVESGEAAVEWSKGNQADLMILDMIMEPGIDGCETYQRILEIRSGQRAIIASGYAENDRVRAAQALGAGTYVRKPYTLERLAVAVRAELEKPL